jgi:predicted RNA methylase
LLTVLASVDRDDAEAIVAALARAGTTGAKIALAQWQSARAPLRARLVDLLGRLARQLDDASLREALVLAASDADLAAARKAIVMLGKLGTAHRLPPALETQLMERFASSPAPLQRAITECLGKAGSAGALEFLKQQDTGDAEQNRLQARATLMLQRGQHRGSDSRILGETRLPSSMRVALNCRSGLSRLLQGELEQRLPHVKPLRSERDRVSFEYSGNLHDLLRSRIALDVALLQPLRPGSEFFERVLTSIADEALQRTLRAWTQGAIRYRIQWQNAGRGRGATWRLAERVAQRFPDLINDPVAACWECQIDERRREIAWIPRAYDDRRFNYRQSDVPAASHPTLAAALARQAAPKEHDIVWDPFMGSGLELIEIERLTPVRALIGTDVDPKAIEAARKNSVAAGVSKLQTHLADARSHRMDPVTLIISNPPMGRRVARDGALLALLDDFLSNAKQNLAPSGRIVWLSPNGEHTASTAQRLGFTAQRLEAVDLGGFEAELQVLTAPR